MEIGTKVYPHLTAPFGAFCHAVRANGFLFISGFTASGTPQEHGDIVAQTESTMEQIKSNSGGRGRRPRRRNLGDVIKVTVYVPELDRLDEIHQVRFRYFGDHLPASTLVQVDALVRPHLKIEIETVAALPG